VKYILDHEGILLTDQGLLDLNAALALAKKAAESCPVIKGWNPPTRACLVSPEEDDGFKCKQFGSDCCRWNLDAIVDCSYVRGDDVDMSEWIPSDG